MKTNRNLTADWGLEFRHGFRDGIPIGIGYFAVAFSLGIAARNAGLNAIQGFFISLFGMASAGEYAALTVIAAGASYVEMALVTTVANARYLLMSFALSQRLDPNLPLRHRLLIGYSVTDELFAIALARPKPLRPAYSYGSYLAAIPGWSVGTAVGVAAGNLLPARIVSALSVALFGMFLAVIIPPARKNRVILALVFCGFAVSYAAEHWLFVLSSGSRTILLTLILSALAALFFPVKNDTDGVDSGADDNKNNADGVEKGSASRGT